ncbi:hypothetical protein M378DRAFT_171344 [Amanita muscaria Koide BX008]|uniref:Uncharacterized protein n=1 Tax=Amanita muscaria (strain Koide BX008) TaxID=946122 RepID=A0A0C2WM15_AMAMK|nr:hypothetical protein M378DRAFT_171344 [Amanita muscaria Koide BX008]
MNCQCVILIEVYGTTVLHMKESGCKDRYWHGFSLQKSICQVGIGELDLSYLIERYGFDPGKSFGV